MNEIEELSKLDIKKLCPLPSLLLDDLYKNILNNLYLELGIGPVLYLFSPSYSVVNPTSNKTINDFIRKKENVIYYIKEYIINNLAGYSVLLDVNSYFVERNNYLLLARLTEMDSGGRRYETKFYTHSPEGLLIHYKDKIYIGRTFIDLFQFKKEYFEIKELIVSLRDQYRILLDKGEETLKNPLDYQSFFQEIRESVIELLSESSLIIESLPPYLDLKKLKGEDLIDIKARYRTVKHYLIELNGEMAEFENLLRFKKEVNFARYITKYKKDLENLISYFNIKINGCLAEKMNNLRGEERLEDQARYPKRAPME